MCKTFGKLPTLNWNPKFLWVDFSFNIPERRARFTLFLPSRWLLWDIFAQPVESDLSLNKVWHSRSDRLFRLWNQQTPLSPRTPHLNVCLTFSYLCTSITQTSKIRTRNIQLRYATNIDLILITLAFYISNYSSICNTS